MEDRTQIKFDNPDIDGSTAPKMVVLEQDTPIEGTVERDGQPHTYHKWLCTDMTYFMASDTLDAMLKSIPSRVGVPIKIEKVENPKGGFPFFHVNGMSKDDIGRLNDPSQAPPPPPPSPAPTEGVTLESINQKLDRIIAHLMPEPETPDLPF